jgi:hypothetical protein
MKYTKQITLTILSKNPKCVFISNSYFRKDTGLFSRYFIGDCNTFDRISIITAKKKGILYLSFLSFRLNAENEIKVEKHSHSPPKNGY